MTLSKIEYIPLRSAYLCPDCNTIGNCATQCPACASRMLMGLSAILDREETAEIAPLSVMPSVSSEHQVSSAHRVTMAA
jgi:coenzyme F420-reducing hydrogenase gamma subunit